MTVTSLAAAVSALASGPEGLAGPLASAGALGMLAADLAGALRTIGRRRGRLWMRAAARLVRQPRPKGSRRALGQAMVCALAAALVVAVIAGLTQAPPVGGWTGLLFGLTLVVAAVFDWRWYWLPDRLTLPLLAAGLLVGLAEGALPERAIGAAATAALLLALRAAFRRGRGGEVLGLGDVKLAAAGCAFIGAEPLGGALALAALLALAIASAGAWRSGRSLRADDAVPFGIHLSLAIWLVGAIWPAVPGIAGGLP